MILPLLDCQQYTIRNGVIQSIGNLIYTSFSENHEKETSTRDSLLDVLIERFRDVNAYTRSTVLQTWSLLAKKKINSFKAI